MGIEDGMPGIELTSAFSGLKVEKLGIVSPEFEPQVILPGKGAGNGETL